MTTGVLSPPRSRRKPPTVEVPPGERGGGGGSEWVRLVAAANDIEAHLLVGALAEAGIEACTLTDRSGPGAWLLGGSNPWAPVEVRVRRFQLDDARLLLAELALAAPDARERAPASSRRTHVPLVWWVTAIALGVLFTALALAQLARSMTPCQIPLFCANEEVERP